MPDDIIQKSYILGSAEKRLVDEYLTPLGLREKFINVSDNEWVYTSNLYITANPYPHCSHLGPLYKKLGDKLKNYFNISNLPARRYILSNRKSYMRQIHNFDNLSKAIQDAFPSNKYEKVIDERLTIGETAKLYGDAKFLYLVVGSNCFKSLVLNEKGSYVLVGTGAYDDSAINAIGSNGNKIVYYVEPSISHKDYSYNVLNITLAIKACSIANYYINNSRFPTDPAGSLIL